MKRGIWRVAAVVSGLIAATGRVSAAEETSETVGGVTWSYEVESDGTATVTRANPALGDVAIPASLGGHPVRRIGKDAFNGCTAMTGVTIPDGVTEIGMQAFADCRALAALEFPDSVTSIGLYAIYRCDGLTELSIGNGVKHLASYGISQCGGLKRIRIPAGLEDIAFRGIYSCDAMEEYVVDGNNAKYESDRGVLFSKGKGTLMRYPAGREGAYAIPEGVECIDWDAFYRCRGLTAVTIPEGVTNIDYQAFSECSGLTAVTIPEGVEKIGEFAFYRCSGLESVRIPASVNWIDSYAFTDCGKLKDIAVANESLHYESEDGVLFTKGKECLVCCPAGKTGTYSISEEVKSIGLYAFGYCVRLTNVIIPEGVAEIGASAFSHCTGLVTLRFPESVTRMNDYVFQGCSGLATLLVPASWKGTTMLKDAMLPEECEIVYYATATGLTPVPVPYRWLEEKAGTILAENDGDYKAAALEKAANGRPVWECYVAGLDPLDKDSELRVTGTWTGSNLAVSVVGGEQEGRTYVTEGTAALSETNAWGPPDANTRFYRVRVEMAE